MKSEYKRILLHLFLEFIALMIGYLLQTSVFTQLPIRTVKPLILPVLVICMATLQGSWKGGLFGLFGGILCDVSLNQPAVMFTLLLTACGLFFGYLVETTMVRGILTCLVGSVVTLLLCTVVQIAFSQASTGLPNSAYVPVLLIQMAYSLPFAFVLFPLERWIYRKTRK